MNDSQKEEKSIDEVSLKEIILKIQYFIKYLFSKWYIIIMAIIIGAVGGYIYSSNKEVLYTAVCTFVVESAPTTPRLTGIAALLSGGSSEGEGLFQGQTLLALYKTRLMLHKTLFSAVGVDDKQILLIDWYLQINNEHRRWAQIDSTQRPALLNSIIGKISSEYVDVESSSMIIVKVQSPNELFSQAFAEKLIETVNNFYVQTKIKKSLTNLNILQKQADSLRRILTISMTGAAAAADAHPNANAAMRVLGVDAQRRTVDVQATTSLYSGVVTSLGTTKMELRKETPLIQIIDRPVLPLSKDVPKVKKWTLVCGFVSGIIASVLILLHLFYKKIMFDGEV